MVAICLLMSGSIEIRNLESELSQIEKYVFYTEYKDVDLYWEKYACLPLNYVNGFITERMNDYVMRGGDIFYDYEKILPQKPNGDSRSGREVDVDLFEGYDFTWRGTNRLVCSADVAVYYSTDYYKTFRLLISDPGDDNMPQFIQNTAQNLR